MIGTLTHAFACNLHVSNRSLLNSSSVIRPIAKQPAIAFGHKLMFTIVNRDNNENQKSLSLRLCQSCFHISFQSCDPMGVWIDDCPILDEQPYSHFFYQLVPVVFVTRGRHY